MLKQLVIIGCVFSACAKPPAHAKQAQEVTKAFIQKIKGEKGFQSLGSGGFYTDQKIDSLYVDFEVSKEVTPVEALTLLTETIDEFIAFVNQNEGIRPFLRTYPITQDQVSASIAFVNEKRVPVQGLSQIHLYNGVTYYSSFDPFTKKFIPYQKGLLH